MLCFYTSFLGAGGKHKLKVPSGHVDPQHSVGTAVSPS